MKFTDFLLMVAQMRDAQRAYYANRTQSNLIAAKAKEKDVDHAIITATSEINDFRDTRQLDMFAEQIAAEGARNAALRRTDPDAPGVDDRLERSTT